LLDLTFLHLLGYIYRMRDYHSQEENQRVYEKGESNSYYDVTKQQNFRLRGNYHSSVSPYWARELPAGWRDIDHGLTQDYIVENKPLFRNRLGGLDEVTRPRQEGQAFEHMLSSLENAANVQNMCQVSSP
jgi:hypothetical protein